MQHLCAEPEARCQEPVLFPMIHVPRRQDFSLVGHWGLLRFCGCMPVKVHHTQKWEGLLSDKWSKENGWHYDVDTMTLCWWVWWVVGELCVTCPGLDSGSCPTPASQDSDLPFLSWSSLPHLSKIHRILFVYNRKFFLAAPEPWFPNPDYNDYNPSAAVDKHLANCSNILQLLRSRILENRKSSTD